MNNNDTNPDPLAPARGIVNGMLISLFLFWLPVCLIVMWWPK